MITATFQDDSNSLKLFMVTFLSAFMLVFGAALLVLMFLPVIVGALTPRPEYHPQLPLSSDREEHYLSDDLYAGKTLYPPLSQSDPIEPGNWIRIPSINVKVPLVMSASIHDKDVLATLDKGAALYPNGVLPGRLGNAFISAHSTGEPWKGKYRFAFLRINEVAPGNIIHLDWEGTRYTFRVSGSEIVTPAPDFRIASDRPVPTVTLMACWPLWTTNQRMLIKGELVNVTPLAASQVL